MLLRVVVACAAAPLLRVALDMLAVERFAAVAVVAAVESVDAVAVGSFVVAAAAVESFAV